MSVREITELFLSILKNKSEFTPSVIIQDSLPENPYEANFLSLDISKAFFTIGWRPRLTVSEGVKLTADYYNKIRHDSDYGHIMNQIKVFYEKR